MLLDKSKSGFDFVPARRNMTIFCSEKETNHTVLKVLTKEQD